VSIVNTCMKEGVTNVIIEVLWLMKTVLTILGAGVLDGIYGAVVVGDVGSVMVIVKLWYFVDSPESEGTISGNNLVKSQRPISALLKSRGVPRNNGLIGKEIKTEITNLSLIYNWFDKSINTCASTWTIFITHTH